MHRRPRWLRIGARIGERIHVIQILDSTRKRHLAAPLYLGRNGRLLSDRALFFPRGSKEGNTQACVSRRAHRVLLLSSHSRSRATHTHVCNVCICTFLPPFSFCPFSLLPGRTTALRERTNQFVVPPIYFHSSRRLQPTEKTNLALVPSLSCDAVSTIRVGPLFLFLRVSFFLLTFHSRLPAPTTKQRLT